MRTPKELRIEGEVAAGFEPVRRAFEENFTRRHEVGGACCVYRRGEKVVDLWGGLRDADSAEPWQERTMVLVHSASKGMAAMTMALAHSRGALDWDERVATYWPEFAAAGKERITVRQLLAHQAGLFALDVPVDRALVADPDRLARVLERQRPAWEPGTRQGYHAVTLGFYEAELLRRVDPAHRTLGRYFEEEIARPLGLDFYLRLPASIPNERLARLSRVSVLARLRGFPIGFLFAAFDRHSNLRRSLEGSGLPVDERTIYARELEVPSGGGVGTARALARAYGVFASGGAELGLRPETLAALAAPALAPTGGDHDVCLGAPGVRFSLGFMKSGPAWPFGGEGSYGAPGFGGALGYADPATGIGYGYVTNRASASITGDPRDVALRAALDAIVPPVTGERAPRAA